MFRFPSPWQIVDLVLVAIGLCFGVALTALAQDNRLKLEPQAGDLAGYYTCKGVEQHGPAVKEYAGIVAIERKGEVYLVQWLAGGSALAGIGIRQGEYFAVSWAQSGPMGSMKGVNLYRVEKGPRLVGRWASLPGPGTLQSETLTFLKEIDQAAED